MTQFQPGFRLFYQEAGRGLPLLCLHGHPGSSRSMAVFTEHFAPRFRTIAPDLRGYGRSLRTGPFVMTDHLDDLERLLDQLGVDRCLVLGWSLGGILALSLALRDLDRASDRIAGLILVATAARPWGDHPRTTWLDLVYTVLAGGLNHLFPGQPWLIETLGRRSLLRHLIQQHNPKTYRYLAQSALLDVWQPTFRNSITSILELNATSICNLFTSKHPRTSLFVVTTSVVPLGA